MKRNLSILIAALLLSACGGEVLGGGDGASDTGGGSGSGGAAAGGQGATSGGNGGGSTSGPASVNPCAPGGEPTLLVRNPSQRARSVATDGQNVYWTTWGTDSNQNGGMIVMAPIAGGSPVTLAANEGTTTSIAVDARNVYWVNYGQSVRMVPKSGGAAISLTTAADGEVERMAIDATYVYFTSTAGVQRVPIAGGKTERLADEGAGTAGADALAVDDAHVFWINRATTGSTASSVMRIAKTGGEPTVLAAGAFGSSTDIGLDAENVYASSMDDGTLLKLSKEGGAAAVIASGLRCPDAVRVDGSGVYVSNNAVACPSVDESFASRAILRAGEGGATPAPVGNAQRTGIEGGFATDDRNVYWAGDDGPVSAIFCAAK